MRKDLMKAHDQHGKNGLYLIGVAGSCVGLFLFQNGRVFWLITLVVFIYFFVLFIRGVIKFNKYLK